MLNAKRIFFIVVSNVYEAFDFSASGFIQLLIRKAHPPRAGSNALMRRNIAISHECTRSHKDENGGRINRRIGERSPRRPGLKAWPSLRVRCSGGLAETIFYFLAKHTNATGIFRIRNRGNGISEIEGKGATGSAERKSGDERVSIGMVSVRSTASRQTFSRSFLRCPY